MRQNKLVTLLSDFGLQDVYVGVMKGAIARVDPSLTAIDLTHQIPPQDLAAARFCLLNACPYFPAGTVHVAVVDPGVGSRRRGVAIANSLGYFVGPDNGIFSGILAQFPATAAVELTNADYWLTPSPSQTFHGRDIFAPVGGAIATGVPLADLGNAIAPESLTQLPFPQPHIAQQEIVGQIQYIDRFGNLISTIRATAVADRSWWVRLGDRLIPQSPTYSDRPTGEIVALIGSHNWVEIAVNGGSAASVLGLRVQDSIELFIEH